MSSAQPQTAIGGLIEKVVTWNPVRDAPDDEIAYIDLSAVDNSTKSITSHQSVVGSNAPSRARQRIKAGDILISTVRPNLNGVAQVPVDLDGATASTGFCVLRPKTAKLDANYLFHWVRSANFIDDMVRKATGASYPAVSDKIIARSEIPLPSLDEQKRIAAILDQADALRRLRQRSLDRLGNLSQAIFYEMFGDVRVNSMGWVDDVILGDMTDIVSGITKGRKLGNEPVRNVPYLAVANVQDKRLKLDAVKTIEATAKEIDRFRLRKDDLLLTEGGDPDKLGRGTLWNDELPEAIHQNHVFRVRITNDRIHPVFLNWLIGSQRGKTYFMNAAKQTTGIASINMGQLRRFPMLLPPLGTQQQFADKTAELSRIFKSASSIQDKENALFASLQHRAFRGEL